MSQTTVPATYVCKWHELSSGTYNCQKERMHTNLWYHLQISSVQTCSMYFRPFPSTYSMCHGIFSDQNHWKSSLLDVRHIFKIKNFILDITNVYMNFINPFSERWFSKIYHSIRCMSQWFCWKFSIPGLQSSIKIIAVIWLLFCS